MDSADAYDVIGLLGDGGLARVYLARCSAPWTAEPPPAGGSAAADGSQLVALKVVCRADAAARGKAEDFAMERRLLRECAHPFVVKLHGAFSWGARHDCLALEHCAAGDLFAVAGRFGVLARVPEAVARFYACELVTFSRTVWRMYGGSKGLMMWYYL
jgi:serine/threonine protein kinase